MYLLLHRWCSYWPLEGFQKPSQFSHWWYADEILSGNYLLYCHTGCSRNKSCASLRIRQVACIPRSTLLVWVACWDRFLCKLEWTALERHQKSYYSLWLFFPVDYPPLWVAVRWRIPSEVPGVHTKVKDTLAIDGLEFDFHFLTAK